MARFYGCQYPQASATSCRVKKTKSAKLPLLKKSELLAMRKTESVLIRMSKHDKELLFATAKGLHLTATELLTRLARTAAEKLGEGR